MCDCEFLAFTLLKPSLVKVVKVEPSEAGFGEGLSIGYRSKLE